MEKGPGDQISPGRDGQPSPTTPRPRTGMPPSLPTADTRAPLARPLSHPANVPTPPVSHLLPRAGDRPEHGVSLIRLIHPKP
jgi:hypothetical protein